MKSLNESEELIQWIDRKINGVSVSSDEKTRIVAGCFDVVLENHKAIILLLSNKLNGSAFSLIRVQFEACVRGLWLKHCASTSQIEEFKDEKLQKTFAQILAEVETKDGYKNGVLSRAKNAGWGAMNSFTHTGYSQVVRRNTESYIEPNYDIDEIEEVISFANALGLFASLEISILSGNNQLIKEISDKVKEL